MNIVIESQVKENYGAHDWDGKGECPQYWKFKGGNSYVFKNAENFNEALRYFNEVIAIPGPYFREYVVNITEIIAPVGMFITDYEHDQLKYEGKIRYESLRIDMKDPAVQNKWAAQNESRLS